MRLLRTSMLGLAAAGTIALAGCSGRSDYDTVRDQLLIVMMEAMADNTGTGIMLDVRAPGKGEWQLATGLADVAAVEPMTFDRHWRIGSLTKTFTATVALQLVEEKVLHLDNPLALYCPPQVAESNIPPLPNADSITLRMLLSHTSGVFNFSDIPAVIEEFTTRPLRRWKPEELIAAAATQPAYFPPGQGYHYSNTNYYILGMIVEQVTGDTIEHQIQRRIFDRLGLTQTSFATTPSLPAPFVHSYIDSSVDGSLVDTSIFDPSFGWAAGAVVSTVADLTRYAAALTDGSLLGAQLQRERLEWYAPASRGLAEEGLSSSAYGLGIANLGGFYGHSGNVLGYTTLSLQRPTDDATIVFMSNNPTFQQGPMLRQIVGIVFPETSL